MELKDFIKNVLSDIANAVKESQTELKDVAIVNPPSSTSQYAGGTISHYAIKDVEFDIALSASSEKGGKAGISVLAGNLASTSRESTRVKFSIPVSLSAGVREQYVTSKNPKPSCDEPTATITQNE